MRFPCPECGAMLRAASELVGKRLACPKCKTLVTVPAAEDTPAGASPALSLVDPAEFGANGGHLGVDDRSPPQTNPLALGPGMPSRLGRYRLVRKLGQGGMGTVYEAIQEGLERRVAVKVLFQHWTHNRDFVERFQREARAAAALDHPNIVTVYDIGEDQGFHFFSMALIDGESLDRRVKREGKLPVTEALGLIVQAVQGLAHAWGRGIIHRDIKPANLLVTKAGVLKIADFGIAKAATTEALGLTQTGTSLGTPYYTSPEQSANAGDVDFRADEYSLGATFYHLVTGRVPFAGSSPVEVAVKAATAQLPPVRSVNPDVPPLVAEVIERMLARYKEDRFGSAAEIANALRSLTRNAGTAMAEGAAAKVRAPVRPADAAGKPARARPWAAAGRQFGGPAAREWLRRYGVWLTSGCACLVLVAIVLGLFVRPERDDRGLPIPSDASDSAAGGSVSSREGSAKPKSQPEKPELKADAANDSTEASAAHQSTGGVPTPASEPPPKAETQTAKSGSRVAAVESITPPLAVAPFDAAVARRHQDEWAERLAAPVEVTNSVGMEFVLVPPGEFLMGSPDSDANSSSDEKPQHRVRITKAFYLGAYEVTQGVYERVMGTNPSGFAEGRGGAADVSGTDTSRHPVESVSWDDAAVFCRKLSAMPEQRGMGRKYRLPTEAEWEYACRAGTTTRYYFGDDAAKLGDYAWFEENSGSTTHPVGEKRANAWGLYDMHGNVEEWCQDWFDPAYYASCPVDDPTGVPQATHRVGRGGGWILDALFLQSAFRLDFEPTDRDSNLGFRVALDLPGK